MTCNELSNPFRWLLACLCLQLHFQNSIWKAFHIFPRKLGEGVVDSNIRSSPVVTSPLSAIQIILSVCLSLNEDCFGIDISVPSHSDGLGTFGLLETTLVQFPGLRIIIVYRGNGRVLGFEFLVWIENKNGKMLQMVSTAMFGEAE